MQSFIQNVGEYLVPVLKESNFPQTGRLTPQEFVLAGDFLTYKCPTWKWSSAQMNPRDYLPGDKQYIMTEAISLHRPTQYLALLSDDADCEFSSVNQPAHTRNDEDLRYYQLFITYDKYYQTPRIWLQGSKPDGTPLQSKETLQDISAEHAQKTVTIEAFPFTKSLLCASIHPCKHAQVMQRINTKGVRVDQYLVLFLKFISSVLPTVEFDNTMAI